MRRTRVGVLSCLAFLAGCAGGDAGLVPVTGKVTYKNQPVAGATVTFVGEGDLKSAVALTQADGTYELMTLDSKGAMPGRYAVVVTKTEIPPGMGAELSMDDAAKMAGKPPPQPKQLLPAKYADQQRTPLRLEVKAGPANIHDLPLTD